jgi:hypothetical protein
MQNVVLAQLHVYLVKLNVVASKSYKFVIWQPTL